MADRRDRRKSKDSTLNFVTRPVDITLDDDPETQRLEMSCGHSVTRESLIAYCRSLLDKGVYKFQCPAIKQRAERCGAVWPYMEVQRIAKLTQEEQNYFEEKMAELAAAACCEFKPCPRCNSYVERQDLTNLCVLCTICTSDCSENFKFCWHCLKTWKGPSPRSDKCDNSNCVNPKLERLLNCDDILLPAVEGVTCPSLRACPTCGNLVEHDTKGCKNIICNRCHIEFCFSCLKITEKCLKTSSHFQPCSDGVAPRQTAIPTWRK